MEELCLSGPATDQQTNHFQSQQCDGKDFILDFLIIYPVSKPCQNTYQHNKKCNAPICWQAGEVVSIRFVICIKVISYVYELIVYFILHLFELLVL